MNAYDPSGSSRPERFGIAARDEHEVAVERAVPHRARAIDARMEPIVGAEHFVRGTDGEELRRRSGHEEAIVIDGVHRLLASRVVELHSPERVRELGAIHHLLDSLVRRRLRGGASGREDNERRGRDAQERAHDGRG